MKRSKILALLLAVTVLSWAVQPVSADTLWGNEAENARYASSVFGILDTVDVFTPNSTVLLMPIIVTVEVISGIWSFVL